MEEETQRDILEFRRSRQQLAGVTNQKQQLQLQSETLKVALEELQESKEEKVYKAVGNILILKKTSDVKKELKEGKETIDLRLKTVQKQEDSLVNKLNKLRAKIESKVGQSPDLGETAVVTEEKGEKKKK